jgi:hypothetical protein
VEWPAGSLCAVAAGRAAAVETGDVDMPHEGSRGIGRVAAVALIGGVITLAATPAAAMAAGAVGPAPDGTRVTGTGDGHIWADHVATDDGNPWHGARPSAGPAAGTDGNPWHDGEPRVLSIGDGHPWHNVLAADGHI